MSRIAKGKASLPTKVLVLGKVFNIEYVKNLKDDEPDIHGKKEELFGDTDGRNFHIRINSSYPLDLQRYTIVHEILHAGFSVSGVNNLLTEELEETIVSCVESILAHTVNLTLFAVPGEEDNT